MSRFVIDASIVLSWCFPDEQSALAQHVAGGFKAGDSALAPSFWPHEVLNALLAGERRRRISADLTAQFLTDLPLLPIELARANTENTFTRIQDLGRKHNLTAYDAAYLDLALATRLPLATLDQDLSRACESAGGKLIQL